MLVRARPRVNACPAPQISRESPNGWRITGERPSEARERVRCMRVLGVTASASLAAQHPVERWYVEEERVGDDTRDHMRSQDMNGCFSGC